MVVGYCVCYGGPAVVMTTDSCLYFSSISLGHQTYV
jgi:hypothetical protein